MGSVVKNMHLDIVLQASFVKAVVLQAQKKDTITAKKRNCTDYGSFQQVAYLSGRLRQVTSHYASCFEGNAFRVL